tara:strand:+ start:115 stop:375 length:261 start_codon:yes stop_codon:yes gene_type:complete
MDINQLLEVVKNKINDNVVCEKIEIEDKTFLHKKHKSFQVGKFHIKVKINSLYLSKLQKVESSKIIHKILKDELEKYIHSLQISIE